MANVRAGVAYVDIRLGSIERFKTELKQKIEQVGTESGEGFGKEFVKKTTTKIKQEAPKVGQEFAGGFISSASQQLRTLMPVLRTALIGGITVAAIALSPLVVSAIGGGIIAAVGAGIIGAGILGAVLADPKIEKAGTAAGDKFKAAFERSTFLFRNPVLEVIKNFQNAIPGFETLMRRIFANTYQYVEPLGRVLIGIFGDLLIGLDKLSPKIKPIMDALFTGLLAIGKAVGDFFAKLGEDPEAIAGFAEGLKDILTVATGMIIIFGDVLIFFAKFYKNIKDGWGNLKAWWNGTIVPSWKRAGQQFMDIWNAVINFFKSFWSRFTDGWRKAKSSFDTSVNAMKTSAANTVRAVATTFSTLPGKIVGYFANLGARLVSAGYNAMMGFLRGLTSGAGAVIGKARDIANTVVSTIMGALKIGSPSKVMERLGMWTMKGFQLGLDKNAVDIGAAIPGVMTTRVDTNFGSPAEPLMDQGTNAALHIDNYYANDNVDPWRQSEAWYFMVSSRGAVS